MYDGQMAPIRIAFAGASGTGKTTVAKRVAEALSLPINPVGSRSVALSMGYANPYDVDKAGRRAEFQRRLVTEKRAWEDSHESFVSDRTVMDNLCYTIMHDISAVDNGLLQQVLEGMDRYTEIVLFPVGGFCNLGGDPNRVPDRTYHVIYEIILKGLLDEYCRSGYQVLPFHCRDVEERTRDILWRAGQ